MNRGFAMVMVMMSITFISMSLLSFTYVHQLRKLQIINLQAKTQAKLNAYSGMKLALLLISLYGEVRSEEDLSKERLASLESFLFDLPLTFPPPIPPSDNKAAQLMIDNMLSSIVINGSFSCSIVRKSGGIPINRLKIVVPKEGEDSSVILAPLLQMRQYLREYIVRKINARKSAEQAKEAAFPPLEEGEELSEHLKDFNEEMASKLVDELIYFINNRYTYDYFPEGNLSQQFDTIYADAQITPKRASLDNKSELNLLAASPLWLIELLADDFVYDHISYFNIHQMNREQWQRFFAALLSDEQIDQILLYRDGDGGENMAHPFIDLNEFKNYMTSVLNIDERSYQEHLSRMEQAGMQLSMVENNFLVSCGGMYNDYNVTLDAQINLIDINKGKRALQKQGENLPEKFHPVLVSVQMD